MTDDIDRIARAWYARFHAKDWDDQSAASRQFMMHATEELVASARDAIGLTASDLAGLAEGTHVVVPVSPTKATVSAMAAAIWRAWLSSPLGSVLLGDEASPSWDELCLLAMRSETLARYRDTAVAEARAAHAALLAARPDAKEE